jgi:GNAT superfamily N-acetyltransferase
MAGITGSLTSTSAGGGLRPFEARRDLSAVADLIELGFANTLDEDGQRYLRQMRSAVRGSGWLSWTSLVAYWASGPMSGYVWEEDGRMVGNLSLIPFVLHSRRCFLIANVVVHPDYRRQGIGRTLTIQGIEHARRAAAPSVWLHVREENDAAVALYRSLGFEERARRTTWQTDAGASVGGSYNSETPSGVMQHRSIPAGLQLGPRRAGHWSQQHEWLRRIYPPELTWHLPLKIDTLRPGIFGAFSRLISEVYLAQWSVELDSALMAAAAWQSTNGYADCLWLSALPESDPGAVEALLAYTCSHAPTRRPLSLDFPAHQLEGAFRGAGFRAKQTLIWMEVGL